MTPSSFLTGSAPAALLLVVDLTKFSAEDRSTLLGIISKVPGAALDEQPTLAAPIGKSFPLTAGQAKALLSAIDDRTRDVLRAMVDAYNPATGKGEVNWLDIRQIVYGLDRKAAGTNEWQRFTKGHISGLHRSLRYITKDPKATLLTATGKAFFIDGPAIEALRSQFTTN